MRYSISSGAILIAMAAVLWGTTGTAQAFAPEGATPLTVGALRILVGGVALFTVALMRGGFRGQQHWHLWTTALAAVSTATYQLTFFGGVHLAGVAVGTMVGIGSAPLFAGLLDWLFEKQTLSMRWAVATITAIIGCTLLVTSGSRDVAINPLGIVLALGAGLSYAMFTLFNKRLLADHTSLEVMAVSFCLGALILLPLLFITQTAWVFTERGIVVVLHLGLIATGLSYMLFGYGLRTVTVSVAATLSLIEPLTAALLGIFVLSEAVNGRGISGMVLIFFGLTILMSRKPT